MNWITENNIVNFPLEQHEHANALMQVNMLRHFVLANQLFFHPVAYLTRWSMVFMNFALLDVNNFPVGLSSILRRTSLRIYFAVLVFCWSTRMFFVLYSMLLGILVFCPETGEFWALILILLNWRSELDWLRCNIHNISRDSPLWLWFRHKIDVMVDFISIGKKEP